MSKYSVKKITKPNGMVNMQFVKNGAPLHLSVHAGTPYMSTKPSSRTTALTNLEMNILANQVTTKPVMEKVDVNMGGGVVAGGKKRTAAEAGFMSREQKMKAIIKALKC